MATRRDIAMVDYGRMIGGSCVVLNDDRNCGLIEEGGSMERIDELASCVNRNRCGVHDGLVAWIGFENKPTDIEYKDMYAVGSVN